MHVYDPGCAGVHCFQPSVQCPASVWQSAAHSSEWTADVEYQWLPLGWKARGVVRAK